MKTTFDKNLDTGELTITRVMPAPVEKVWEAWTKPEVFEQWWGPHGWETTVKELELKPGGLLLYGMKCVDESQGEWFGQESWGKMVFEEVNPTSEIKYTDYFTDSEGNINEDMPAVKSKLQFESVDGDTKLVSTNIYESGEDLQKVLEMGMEQGLTETWDRLEEVLASSFGEASS